VLPDGLNRTVTDAAFAAAYRRTGAEWAVRWPGDPPPGPAGPPPPGPAGGPGLPAAGRYVVLHVREGDQLGEGGGGYRPLREQELDRLLNRTAPADGGVGWVRGTWVRAGGPGGGRRAAYAR
jgi:hypothetical protein